MSSHITMSNDNGASVMKKSPSPAFEAFEYRGWKGRAVEDSGIFMVLFDIAPEAEEFPIHADESRWLAYVIAGSEPFMPVRPTCKRPTARITDPVTTSRFRPARRTAGRTGPNRVVFCSSSAANCIASEHLLT